MKYKDWIKEWLESIVHPTAKLRTYRRYSELANAHIVSKIGDYEIDALSLLILQKFVSDLLKSGNLVTGKGLSANTVNTIITITQNSLKSAYAFGKAANYTAEQIKRPKVQQREVIGFSIAEQKQIEQAINASRKDKLFGIILCLYTGLRIGELLALEWSDIDIDGGILRITKTCHYSKSENGKFERQIDSPKTYSSLREFLWQGR